MKLIIFDKGDESVGLFPTSYEIDCPFNKDDVEQADLDQFKETMVSIYKEYDCQLAMYDFEIDGENAHYLEEFYEEPEENE